LYGILPSSADIPSIVGIDGWADLALVLEGQIGALVSAVPLADFGRDSLRQNLEDPRWLEEKIRRHEAVVEAAMAKGPILPMKFCTIFLSLEKVRRVLRENTAIWQESLEYLQDKEEWGVKGFSDRRCLQETVMHQDPELLTRLQDLRGKPPGQAFLLKKKLQELASLKAEEQEEEFLHLAEAALRSKVVGFVKSPSLPRRATGRQEEMVLNLACLVSKAHVGEFLAEVARVSHTYTDNGFKLIASGPWPPYNFSPLVKSEDG
jgi:hypothetical protein